MKNLNKLFLILLSILAICLVGCSDDGNIPSMDSQISILQLENESIKVKIGNENKQVLAIEQGGGGYSVFSLDENIAIAKVEDNTVLIEGITNGKTSIIVSDNSGNYRKIDVWSYTTDSEIVLSTKKIDLKSILGYSCSTVVDILLGNGFYSVSSDNVNVEAILTNDGRINIFGTSKREVQVAEITVTDWSGLSGIINVTISPMLDPFTNEQLEEIKGNSALRYVYDKVNILSMIENYADYINMSENGKQTYGWDASSFGSTFRITYDGDKSVGKKENGTLSGFFSGYDSENGNVAGWFENQPVDLEVIKNDGVNIWFIYSLIKNDKLHYGYFCDTVKPASK